MVLFPPLGWELGERQGYQQHLDWTTGYASWVGPLPGSKETLCKLLLSVQGAYPHLDALRKVKRS